jgi:hypothetical protein
MPARLEPRAEKRDVSGPTHTVRTFDDDQLAAVFFLFDARQRRSVKVLLINEFCPASS